jgi:hypothetical protein
VLLLLLVELFYVSLKLWTALFDVNRSSPLILTVLLPLKNNFLEKVLSFWMSRLQPPILRVCPLVVDGLLKLRFIVFVN